MVMAVFTHSISTPSQAITAGQTDTFDLPVNPLSHLFITIAFLNNGANTRATLASILGMIDRFQVLFKGNQIISLNGLDLYLHSLITSMRVGHEVNHANLDNSARSITLLVPFGRYLFDPTECFPATNRGNLTIAIDWASSFTAIDGATITIESVEMPGATPQRMLRATVLSATPAATGDFDIALPIGNPITQLLIFGTTIPTGTALTTTINTAQLLLDNNRRYFTEANWETLHANLGLRIGHIVRDEQHFHRSNQNATYLQNEDTDAAEFNDSIMSNHALLDFDPNRDGQWLLETQGRAAVTLRINAGDTNALRVVPVELIAVPSA